MSNKNPVARIHLAVFLSLMVFASAWAGQSEPRAASQSAVATGPNSRAYNAMNNLVINNKVNNNYPGGRDNSLDVVGSKVAITAAYLVPSIDFFDATRKNSDGEMVNQFHDAAFLCVEVANISSQPLLVTAMKLDVINPQGLRFGPGISGSCPGEKISSMSAACMLQPGERKKWLLEKGMVIPGVVDFLKQQDEFVFDTMKPRLTTNDRIIERFNNFLRGVPGDKTTLKVSIFELNYKPVLIGHFQLAKGRDLFAHEAVSKKVGGKEILVFPLQHDSFLGEAISQIKEGKSDLPTKSCTLEKVRSNTKIGTDDGR